MPVNKEELTAVLSTDQSSVIEQVEYVGSVLIVYFRNGHIYGYENVPQEEYIKLIAAESIGKQFNTSIRNSFTATKLQ